jgi:hypothetical protein
MMRNQNSSVLAIILPPLKIASSLTTLNCCNAVTVSGESVCLESLTPGSQQTPKHGLAPLPPDSAVQSLVEH